MKILNVKPGPKIGGILSVLLDEIIEEPGRNMRENLEFRIKDLGMLSDDELEKLAEISRGKKEEFEEGIEAEIKKKYYVK